MKTLKDITLKSGVRRVTVELATGEKLLALHDDRHYRLGYPVEDVVPSHVVLDATEVSWCCLEQKWRD